MADWNSPALTDNYTSVLDELKARDIDTIRLLDPTHGSPTNIPDGAKRWNTSTNRFEKWNGTSWTELTSELAMNVASLGGQAAANYLLTSNLLANIRLIDGAGSGVDADLLDGLHASSFLQVSNLLSAVRAIDGAGSGVDADLLDGQHASAFVLSSELMNLIKDADGSGSSVDADLLDGFHGAYYLNASNLNAGTVPPARLGFASQSEAEGGSNTTKVMSPLRVAQAIAEQQAPSFQISDSGWQPLSPGMDFSWSHNLGGRPDFTWLELQVATGFSNWVAGTILTIPAHSWDDTNYGVVSWTGTTFAFFSVMPLGFLYTERNGGFVGGLGALHSNLNIRQLCMRLS